MSREDAVDTKTAPRAGRAKATEWRQGSEPLRPASEMVHYEHADDLPSEYQADNFGRLATLARRYMSAEDQGRIDSSL